MTDKEREQQICEECGQPETCGYVIRGKQDECSYLKDALKESSIEELEEAAIYNQLRYIFDEKLNETTLGELKYVGEGNFKDGAQWQKQKLIDKACEWLKEHLWEYDQYSCIRIDVDEMVKDFKQAMED